MVYIFKKYDPSLYLQTQYGCGLGKPSILDEVQSAEIVESMGLFKFKGYLYAFKNELDSRSVEDILMLYGFDRYLSKQLMDLSLKVEAKLKAVLVEAAYALTENPFFYLDTASYNDEFALSSQENADWTPRDKKGQEEIYRHYRDYYMETYDFEANRKTYLDDAVLVTEADGVNFPPFHYFIESATIGTVITMILRLELEGSPLLKPVAKAFGFGQSDVFKGYLFRLKEIRNRCAHNGRLFNRNYRGIKVPKPYRKYFNQSEAHRVINVWMTLLYMLGQIDRYADYAAFEKAEVFKLFEAFKGDGPSNAILQDLPNQYDMKKWLKLSGFILKGMGKR